MSSKVKSLIPAPVAVVSALLLAMGVISSAYGNEQPRSETVKFADLDVVSPSGVQTLYERIHAAARRVCSDGDPLQQLAASACARKAEAKAIAKVSLPQLTAFYQMKNGGQSQTLIATR